MSDDGARQPLDPGEIERLVREVQAGRPESFQRLFDFYFGPVSHFFANRGFSAAAAEDLAQDALFRVYTNIGSFRFEASFKTWLFKIVGSIWKNALRERATLKRQADRLSLEEALGGDEGACKEPDDPADGPLENALASERQRLLAIALGELPPKMRECMLLRLDQGLRNREIAAVMRVSVETVKSQLAAGQKRLKPLLEEHADVFAV